MLKKRATELKGKRGEDIEKWPQVGCGAQITPFKKGAGMAVEVNQADDEWTSFVAEGIPSELDNAIKNHRAQFYLAQKNRTADELLGALPLAFPMTHTVPEFPGIAKYPVDEWERQGAHVVCEVVVQAGHEGGHEGPRQPGQGVRDGPGLRGQG